MGEVFQGIGNGYEGAVMRREEGEVLAASTVHRNVAAHSHHYRNRTVRR